MDTKSAPTFPTVAASKKDSAASPSSATAATMASSSPVGVTTTATQVPATSNALEALKDIAYGSVAGATGKLVEYPFDTVKVRLQSQPDHLPLRYRGPLDCFRQGLQQDGVRGLYRGVSAPLVGAAAETACLFWSYRVAQNLLRSITTTDGRVMEGIDAADPLPLSMLVAAGALSGGVTSLVLTPIELVKCRIQVTRPPTPATVAGAAAPSSVSPFSVIADVYRREGLRGFWRGQLGTLLRETGGSAAWFGSYETLSKFFKSRLKNPDVEIIPIWQQMTSGAIAGMGYNFVFYPADTIKSKIQTGELSHIKPTFMNVGRELWHAHGLKGLYRGCGITVMRSAPSSALIFTIYETLKRSFG